MILAITISIVLIGLLVGACRCDDCGEWFFKGVVIGFILVFVFISTGTLLDNKIKIERMELFQSTTVENYRKVISQTSQLSDEIKKSEFSVEKFALYQSLSQRLVELNEEITEYNRLLIGYRVLKNNLLFNWYYPDLDGLEIINI